MAKVPRPRRSEVWLVRFDPRIGAEIRKSRPALVVSEDTFGRLPLSIVVPIIDWKVGYAVLPWFVFLAPTTENGLSKASAADAF
jgi:mRNA interferase MazF